jgi:outer membrane protein OmpA-like peptidoglycan-associated protein
MYLVSLVTLFCCLLPAASIAAPMVGGSCSYETVIGVARIVSRHGEETDVRFDAGKRGFQTTHVPYSSEMKFTLRQMLHGKRGTRYPAELSIITQGSCTPYNLNLLATEDYVRTRFLSLNNEGQPDTATLLQTEQIAATFTKVLKSWPQLRLNICGESSSARSSEYSQNLGEHYARLFQHKLEALGIAGDQIQLSSAGENSCSGDPLLISENRNGAWLNFQLQANHSPSVIK